MKLIYFPYKGPAFLGVVKIGISFKNVHIIIFGPRGDNYVADMLTMREEPSKIPPIKCTNLSYEELAYGALPRLLKIIRYVLNKYPQDIILIAPTVTSALLKEDIQMIKSNLKESEQERIFFPPVNFFKDEEDISAEKTLFFLVSKANISYSPSKSPSVNLLGISFLNYNYLHDLRIYKEMMKDLGIKVNLTVPLEVSIFELNRIGEGWVNIPSDEVTSYLTLSFLREKYHQPFISSLPYGLKGTKIFIEELGKIVNKDFSDYIFKHEEELFSKYKGVFRGELKKKSVFIFGDFTTSLGLATIFKKDFNCKVCGVGTYNVKYKDLFFERAKKLSENILVTDEVKEVWKRLKEEKPDIVIGTANEEFVASQLNSLFIRISSPLRSVTTSLFPSESFLGYKGLKNLLSKIL